MVMIKVSFRSFPAFRWEHTKEREREKSGEKKRNPHEVNTYDDQEYGFI